jgi:hypothetical protein
MNSVTHAPPVQPTAALRTSSSGAAAPDANPSLLPEPSESVQLDAMSELYAAMAAMRRSNAAQGKGNAEGRLEQKKLHRQQAIEALKKAEEDQDSAGLLGGVANKLGTAGKIAAVAGAVAMVVGTGGAGIAVVAAAGVLLSGAAFVQSETKFLQELGMDNETAMYTELGMLGAGALCSGGAGVAAACEIGTAASTAAATAPAFEKGALVVGAAASVVAGVTGTVSAYAGWRAGEHQADAEEHMSDAAAEQAKAAQVQRLLLQLIDAMEQSEESDQRTLGHLRGAIDAKGSTPMMASARV